jgi:hypothetical protein
VEIIPILLFIAPSWLVATLFYWLSMRPHLNSAELATLNKNLDKVGQYWSNCESGFAILSDGAVAVDLSKAQRQFWVMTAFLSLMSLLGTLLLIAMFMSGQPRLERNTFASRLARDPDMGADEILALIQELKTTI